MTFHVGPRHFRTRLFLSYVVVVAAGATAMLVVSLVVARSVYSHRVGGFGLGNGPGRSGDVTESQLRSALDRSLVPALMIGVVIALAAGAAVATVLARRLLRPIDLMRDATQRMAAGDYDVQVPAPADLELAALAADVNQLGHHLSTTEQRRTRLLGEVTHELRTPITVIRGQMEGLIDGVVEPSDEVFAAVADEAARLQRLVDDLTLLSRADEGTLEIRSTELDLADVAVRAAERLRPQFDDAEVALDVGRARAAAPLLVVADRDRLTQVFSNLLGNALGHTPAGGTVSVIAGTDRTRCWVEVTDTGEGIAAAELGPIFERFYRVGAADVVETEHPRRRPTRAGRGLGLTIARSLVRAQGGEVTASSAGLGTGATFRVTVPAAPDR